MSLTEVASKPRWRKMRAAARQISARRELSGEVASGFEAITQDSKVKTQKSKTPRTRSVTRTHRPHNDRSRLSSCSAFSPFSLLSLFEFCVLIFEFHFAGNTVTLTCAVVQQHWNPLPPSPDESFTCARSTYSPGTVKVAFATALPSVGSTRGLAWSNTTAPGPR